MALFSFFSSLAYPLANLSIPSSYPFQAGLQATIDCRVMPGRLSQNYSVTWWNGSSTIARSNPHSELLRNVLPGYQLHDNFSLTINDIQLSDSSTSYRCSVTIDDPQIPGTDNIIYNNLGNITVVVYGKSLSVYADMLMYFLMMIFVLFRSSKYCDSAGAKGDCSGGRWPPKLHFHL